MRRSKQAKYVRNYRKISQRRMTCEEREYGDGDDAKLRKKEEENFLKEATKLMDSQKQKEMKKKKRKKVRDGMDIDDEDDVIKMKKSRTEDENDNTCEGVLSEELKKELSLLDNNNNAYSVGDNELLVCSGSRKKQKTKTLADRIQLTHEEKKLAKDHHKNFVRKLNQLSKRKEQKKLRQNLYTTLEENAVSEQELSLMKSSKDIGSGGKQTKKQELSYLLKKYRAGMELSSEEHQLLFVSSEINEEDEKEIRLAALKDKQPTDEKSNIDTSVKKKKNKKKSKKKEMKPDSQSDEKKDGALSQSEKNKKRKKPMLVISTKSLNNDEKDEKDESDVEMSSSSSADESEESEREDESKENEETEDQVIAEEKKEIPATGMSFAEQMMSSLATLKQQVNDTVIETQENPEKYYKENKKEDIDEEKTRDEIKVDSEVLNVSSFTNHPTQKKYVASEGIQLTSIENKNPPKKNIVKKKNLPVINRPPDIQEARLQNILPIYAMEFEIMDAIASNSVTIVCGETGSGKSTQLPQFLYEAGYSMSPQEESNNGKKMVIAMTQPRRVAAVSTAKRIAYEMSCPFERKNNLKKKKGDGNLVSYQTRYESSGLGFETQIKVMTDGILLREIQNDLLLRKYSVIVLDEAHERNLNTDVLIGWISKSILLRNSQDSNLPPLKLVIMSATLRVQDFKSTVFPSASIVKVPGRTFPVTIHHSKKTELDQYEDVAYRKVCQIHRKLPPGGILVFLTGKDEIQRMVKRLRKTFGCSDDDKKINSHGKNSETQVEKDDEYNDGPRDLDDDEMDGDLFYKKQRKNAEGDEEEDDDYERMLQEEADGVIDGVEDGHKYKKAVVLPLHSLLSPEDQAKVFTSPNSDEDESNPDAYVRQIVVATNIAETSITIPNISYVVDCGRQKVLCYHPTTNVVSYEIMWISQASANQRAGRAGRTNAGHCYRLYSSALYARQMEQFSLPEIFTKPLEDVVLQMKQMGISSITNFPFVTPPNPKQLQASIELLFHLGCLIGSNSDEGVITHMGKTISKIPLAVKYGKMLFYASQCGVLDYAIIVVAILSESTSSPFEITHEEDNDDENKEEKEDSDENLDEIDKRLQQESEEKKKKELRKNKNKWTQHKGGDVMAALLAIGAYTYAGKGAKGQSEAYVCKRFCEEHGLNFVVMRRIQQLRYQLAKLVHNRSMFDESSGESIAQRTGGVLYNMPPPNVLQETLLRQAILSGLLNNVARLVPRSSVTSRNISFMAYQSCKKEMSREQLFIGRNSSVYSRDYRRLPEWVCYDTIVRKTRKDGTTYCQMTNVTPVDPAWLAFLSTPNTNKNTSTSSSDTTNSTQTGLLSLGAILLDSHPPQYDPKQDMIKCSVKTRFGHPSWEIPPLQVPLKDHTQKDTELLYRWFARFLLEGKILPLTKKKWNDSPVLITRKKPCAKVENLVVELVKKDIYSKSTLVEYWKSKNKKFLYKQALAWVSKENVSEFKQMWMNLVKQQITA